MRILVLLAALVLATPARADTLDVVTSPAPPFIVQNDDGSFSGISVDLWRTLATQLGWQYQIRSLPIADFKECVETACADAFVSLNITAEREQELDLSHAFYSTGLAIAIKPSGSGGGLLATMGKLFSGPFLGAIAWLVLVLAVIGFLMWLAERRRNPRQFGGSAAHGIGAGLWWSAVTMTTVGYGDKAPVTAIGRILALVWMFTAIIVISSITASISSSLTVEEMTTSIHGPADLPGKKVGTVLESAGDKYLERRSIARVTFPDARAALDALDKGQVDAVVYEAPILMYWAKTDHAGAIQVLPGTFDNHGYGFGLKPGSALREPLDRALLAYTATDEWSSLLARYLGGS